MFTIHKAIIFLLLLLPLENICGQGNHSVVHHIDTRSAQYAAIAHQIWEFAEPGYQEVQSSALLQQTLKDAGFKITSGVAGMPTGFTAEYGTGYPVICILGEFDALPGLSQAAMPRKEVKTHGGPGHACGHHLFGVGSAAAAIAVKDWLKNSKTEGIIRYYGTPAEEGGGGKVYMVKAGLFDDVDAVLHWHPASLNSANAASSLANNSTKFRFHGVASHASSSPQFGRSALDGV